MENPVDNLWIICGKEDPVENLVKLFKTQQHLQQVFPPMQIKIEKEFNWLFHFSTETNNNMTDLKKEMYINNKRQCAKTNISQHRRNQQKKQPGSWKNSNTEIKSFIFQRRLTMKKSICYTLST